jgi:UDP:flavonoid glycosyltransferase YjiC (YdhE family)
VRVLFSSTSGLGHVQPMVPIALALQRAGHEVRWATGPSACDRIEAQGITAEPVGLGDQERMAAFRARHPEAAAMPGPELAAFMFPKLFGAIAAPAAIDGLLDLASRWRPDVIVHEQAELAAPALAAALGVPNACHGFGFAVPGDRVQHAADHAAAVWDRVGATPGPYGGCYDHLYIDVYPRSLQPEELPHLGRRVLRRPESGDAAADERLDDDVAARTATGRPLVYVTFGTVFNVNPTFGRVLDAAQELDVEVVATVGPSGDPTAFGPRPDHVHVTTYVPQSLLLPHTAVVASHAGSGTLLATMAAGLPQLGLPQAADQFRNAAACEAAGAGLGLAGDAATTAAIGEALDRLLHDPSFAEGAGRMADEIASMPSPAELVPVLEELAGV